MKPDMHYKRKLKYLNAVADYFISLGYEVEEPNHDDDFLDVYGMHKGRKCFVEIYCIMYECMNETKKYNRGINGIWHQGENEGYEAYLDTTYGYDLDTRFLGDILDGLKPIKKKRVSK